MAEQPSPEFSHEVLEADIKRLAEEIGRRRERPESRVLTGQELVKHSLQSLTQLGPKPAPPATPPSPLPAYAQEAPERTKLEVEYLLDLAFHKGIQKAAAAAKKSDPFVLDAFHDALTDKLYPELVKRGIVQ